MAIRKVVVDVPEETISEALRGALAEVMAGKGEIPPEELAKGVTALEFADYMGCRGPSYWQSKFRRLIRLGIVEVTKARRFNIVEDVYLAPVYRLVDENGEGEGQDQA